MPISDFTDLIGEIEAVDRWQGYAAQRTELLSHIEENQIGGVLWLAGDFHFGLVSKVGRAGELGDEMYEILCGPAGSFINLMGELLIPSEQFQLPVAEWNTTVFTCNPEQGSVTVSFIGDEGQEHASKTLQL